MSRLLRAEVVLPLTIVVAAIVLGASELLTTFQLISGGEPQESLLAADRHGYAQLILAVCAIGATIGAVTSGMRVAAAAAAIFGVAAMLLFLVVDLPDAGRAGPLGDDPALYFADARAEPAIGFWLEAVGSVILGLASVAFATLRSDQLRAPVALFGGNGAVSSGPAESRHSETDAKKPAAAAKTPRPKPSPRRAAVARSEPKARPPGKPPAPPRPAKAADERAAARERLARAQSTQAAGEKRDTGSKARRARPAWLRGPRSNDG